MNYDGVRLTEKEKTTKRKWAVRSGDGFVFDKTWPALSPKMTHFPIWGFYFFFVWAHVNIDF
jgi:hypothetical protein